MHRVCHMQPAKCLACHQAASTLLHCISIHPPGRRYQYHNIFALLDELGIQDALTDWETSGFWSPEQGLTIEAPVFSSKIRLPTMLGQFVHTLPLLRCFTC